MDFKVKSTLKVCECQISGIIEPIYIKQFSGLAMSENISRCWKEDGDLYKCTELEKIAFAICLCNCDKDGNLLQTTDDRKIVMDNLTISQLKEIESKIFEINDFTGEKAKKS